MASEKTKRKLSETRKRLFKEKKIKIWNKGLTKEDERVYKNISGKSRKTQFKKGHNLSKLEKNANWKGGRTINKDGYIMIKYLDHPKAKKNNGYVFEHILVMEKKLKRYLKNNEVVHHINGIKGDNRVINLVVILKKEHVPHHRWNKEYHQILN